MHNYQMNVRFNNIQPNPVTRFNQFSRAPSIPTTSTVHHRATLIGPVAVGHNVFIAPGAVIRSDEGLSILIGNNSNIQDGVVIHGLKNKPGEPHSIVIGNNVSVAHQALIHGPAYVGDNTFIGFQALVFSATVGKNCVIEPAAKVMNCIVADGKYVPAGQLIDSQEKANALPAITDDYKNKHFNSHVVETNRDLAEGYRAYYTARLPAMFYPAPMPVLYNGTYTNLQLKK